MGRSPLDRRELDRLLTRLLDLPPEERPAAVDAACEDDALRGEVLRMLRLADAPDDLLDKDGGWTDRLWRGLAAERTQRESPVAIGTLIGPYRVLEEIGRGGMAVVYRAERVDGELEREVALKILKLGLDTDEVVRRFEQERQILADLDHPNIARLYDAGRTADGRPYFVMERVDGVPIDRYCDERRLSVEARMELFQRVTGAVAYAHQNLVVHRDLKPSNILVNGAGQVKLLDFGIARLVDVDAGDSPSAPPTRTLLRMMTPEYASPEQMRGERVTTASDVYQLGLLLYELLTGHRAYVVPRGSVGELERAICEQEPTRPSTAVHRRETLKRPSDGAETTIEGACRARRLSPARLRRRLRGDLDNIVLTALRKEPSRRYRTADRLGQDIHRHLTGLPVAARPDTWVYRGRKFLERHALGAAVTTVALLLAGSMAAWHVVRIQNERDLAQTERDRAETERARAESALDRAEAEAAKAEEMSQFLIGLFRAADPRETAGANVTARELLDRGVRRVDVELAAQPEIQSNMLLALGRTYTELGVYEEADRLFQRALDLQRRRAGPRHPDLAPILRELGWLRYQEGRYGLAVERLEQAVRILETAPEADPVELSRALGFLAGAFERLGEPNKSLLALERALSFQEQVSGEDSEPVASILSNMANVRMVMGELDRAEGLYQQALAVYERELGPDHPLVGSTLMNLANLRQYQGSTEGLEEMYRRSLAIQETAYGADHLRVARVRSNLGDLLVTLERIDEATAVLERSLEIYAAALRPDHPEVAYPLASLGNAHLAAGRLREARDYFRRSVTLRERIAGAPRFDPLLAYDLARLGRIEAELGNASEAAPILDRALRAWSGAPDSTDPQFAPALLDLGRWLVERGRCADAIPLLRRGAGLQLPPQSPWSPAVAELQGLLTGCS